MRVIAGRAKGVRLAPVPAGTRPLSDRAREGLFSSLAGLVPEARCADLFAGTGAIGIEALSRGAASCLFVDRGAEAARTIRRNLERTGLADRATVIPAEVATALGDRAGPFDLAFLDPPYDLPHGRLRDVLDRLVTLMVEGGRIALTRPKKDSTDVIPLNWETVRLLAYGDARILVMAEAA
jgi:16S rRNA (guanine966-N2)-methyltransferase